MMQYSVESAAYTGDVTALCTARLPPAASRGTAATTVLLAGMGSQLHVYVLPSGQRCCCAAVLPDAARLHGIAWLHEAPSPGTAAGVGRPQLLLAVHGGRHAALLRLLGPAAVAGNDDGCSGWEVQLLVQLMRFQHWTMDVQLSIGAHTGSGTSTVHLAVGLSSNAVEAFSIALPCQAQPQMQRVVQAECTERCLLYSMAMLPQRQAILGSSDGSSGGGGSGSTGEAFWLVAGGSVFLDVLVWATPAAAAPTTAVAAPTAGLGLGSSAAMVAPTLYRLKGHEGSIHRVRWAPCGCVLASASDDRSIRLWAIPPSTAAGAASPAANSSAATARGGNTATVAALLQPQRVLWGHTARLWDCGFGGSSSSCCCCNSGSAFLATVSEDCSARLYCLATGQLLCAVQGHRGRGIWHCALLEPPQRSEEPCERTSDATAAAAAAAARCCLFTGGADSSIKCWRLADWLPGADAAPAALPTAHCFMLQGVPPDPATAAVSGGASYGSDHGLHPGAAQQQHQAAHSDSRQEWVRCLALANSDFCGASSDCSSSGRPPRLGGNGDGSSSGRARRHWLYVGTNRGLLHRVHLPDAAAGQEERWVCLLKGGINSGKPMPLMSLTVLQPLPAGSSSGGRERYESSDQSSSDGGIGSSPQAGGCSVWVAAVDFGGTATVLLDSLGMRHPSPASCCRWQPYGPIPPGHVGIWWGSPSSGGSSCSSDSGLGSCCCFTARGGLLTMWLLPGQGQGEQQPERLAEAQLPFASQVAVLAAVLLPRRYGPVPQQQAALVAVGNTNGGVVVLLLLVPQWAQLGSQPAAHPPGVAAAAAAAGSTVQLLVLAASSRVCERTPVRMIQVHLLPHLQVTSCSMDGLTAASAYLARQLEGAEVLTAGGDGIIRVLRLPAAALAAAVVAAAAGVTGGSAAAGAATGAGRGGGETGEAAAPPPRLLCTRSRRYNAVTHIDGIAGSGGGGSIVYGFHSSHFAVWDEGAEADVARVECGGWRRPAAADVAGGDDLALCFMQDARLWLYRRQPLPSSGSTVAPPRCLHPPDHGLEQECIRLLAVPASSLGSAGGGIPAAMCCLTGGDDGMLRQKLLALPYTSTHVIGVTSSNGSRVGGGGVFSVGAHLADTVQGTAVKSLALLPLPCSSGNCGSSSRVPHEWLLLAAGAKQSLMACRVSQRQQEDQQQQVLPLACDELVVKEPAVGPRCKPTTGNQRPESDQRYLAISAFLWQQQPPPPAASVAAIAAPLSRGCEPSPLHVFVVAAASDASLALLSAELASSSTDLALTHCQKPGSSQRQPQWHEAAALQHHTYPVLCTAHCCLEMEADDMAGNAGSNSSSSSTRQWHIVCSGATDGSVAVWDVTAAAALATSGPGTPRLHQLQPLLTLEDLHQSGVNSMAVIAAGPGRLLLLAGGDDQSLSLTLLQLLPGVDEASDSTPHASSGSIACMKVLLRLSIPNAHSSAVRSVWLGPVAIPAAAAGAAAAAAGVAAVAFSVGLDQQVRCWQLLLEQLQLEPHGQQRPARPPGLTMGSLVPAVLDGGAVEVVDGELEALGGWPWMEAARYRADSSSACVEVAEVGCQFTQVVEPAALDVLPLSVSASQQVGPGAEDKVGGHPGALHGVLRYLVGVAGRGTELMLWQLPA